MSGKRYSDGFKIETAKPGLSAAELAGRLCITTHGLSAWIKKFGPGLADCAARDQQELRAECFINGRRVMALAYY